VDTLFNFLVVLVDGVTCQLATERDHLSADKVAVAVAAAQIASLVLALTGR